MLWKQINTTRGLYSVSEYGDVRNDVTNRILTPYKNSKGYLRVMLPDKRWFIHRLVGTLFILNPNNKPQINHIDGNKLNNHYSNLEWNTNLENRQHAIDNNLCKPNVFGRGEQHMNAVITNIQAKEIKNLKGTMSAKHVAEIYNIPAINVYKMWDNSMWKWI